MSVSPEYREFVIELLADLGPVSVKSMFGGAGVYLHDVMFAIISQETLFFKVGEENREDFQSEGMRPFTYDGKGRRIEMSYWEVPERLYDDSDEITEWARKALDAALKAKSSKSHKKSSSEHQRKRT